MEDVVQRDGEFDDAEIGAEMPAVVGEHGDQPLANFRRQLVELGEGELPHLLGGINLFE